MEKLILKITKNEMKSKLNYKLLSAILDISLFITIFKYLNIVSILEHHNIFLKHSGVLIMNLIVLLIILNPIHEYIHYIIIKNYSSNCVVEISFLIIVFSYRNGVWSNSWRLQTNSNVQETSGKLFTRNQYIKVLIAPFITISLPYIIFGFISHNFLLMITLLIFNAQLSINDINETIILLKYNKNYYVRMFNKDRINRGFEVIKKVSYVDLEK